MPSNTRGREICLGLSLRVFTGGRPSRRSVVGWPNAVLGFGQIIQHP
jgi:hypothetical protein